MKEPAPPGVLQEKAVQIDGTPLVMLLEDEINTCELLEAIIRQEGYSVVSAHNLKEADEIFKKITPSVLILDIILPDGDGIQYLGKLP